MDLEGSEIERLLAATRLDSAEDFPADLLIDDPLVPDEPYEPEHPFDVWVHSRAMSLEGLSGCVIGVDLDDTLLNTNYICGAAWDEKPEGIPSTECRCSIHYGKMVRPLSFWLKAGWRRPLREQFDSARYPFLRNPPVEAQLRPGALALLNGLKKAGAILVLLTMCARERVAFLLSRIPQLGHPFQQPDGSQAIICAEALLESYRKRLSEEEPRMPESLPEDMVDDWKAACAMHRENPDRFGVKSLIVVNRILGMRRLDLLLDDSETIQKDYMDSGLDNRILRIPRKDPFSRILGEIPAMIAHRFKMKDIESSPLKAVSLQGYPLLRFEDPLYYPLVHASEFYPEREGGLS